MFHSVKDRTGQLFNSFRGPAARASKSERHCDAKSKDTGEIYALQSSLRIIKQTSFSNSTPALEL